MISSLLPLLVFLGGGFPDYNRLQKKKVGTLVPSALLEDHRRKGLLPSRVSGFGT